MRYVLTNAMWRELEPRVAAAKRSRAGAKPAVSDRLFLEAVLYRARTGLPWRDLPADSSLAEVRRVYVDSTTVRAHPHAAGAEKKRTRRPPSSGGAGAG